MGIGEFRFRDMIFGYRYFASTSHPPFSDFVSFLNELQSSLEWPASYSRQLRDATTAQKSSTNHTVVAKPAEHNDELLVFGDSTMMTPKPVVNKTDENATVNNTNESSEADIDDSFEDTTYYTGGAVSVAASLIILCWQAFGRNDDDDDDDDNQGANAAKKD